MRDEAEAEGQWGGWRLESARTPNSLVSRGRHRSPARELICGDRPLALIGSALLARSLPSASALLSSAPFGAHAETFYSTSTSTHSSFFCGPLDLCRVRAAAHT